jgi:hypothetical protein
MSLEVFLDFSAFGCKYSNRKEAAPPQFPGDLPTMITAGTMQPLPVRPHDGFAKPAPLAPMPQLRSVTTMHPLPMPTHDVVELADAIRATAFRRMQDHNVNHPLPVVRPTS